MVANRMRATKKYVREKPQDDTNSSTTEKTILPVPIPAADNKEDASKSEHVKHEVRFKSHMFNHTKLEGR